MSPKEKRVHKVFGESSGRAGDTEQGSNRRAQGPQSSLLPDRRHSLRDKTKFNSELSLYLLNSSYTLYFLILCV